MQCNQSTLARSLPRRRTSWPPHRQKYSWQKYPRHPHALSPAHSCSIHSARTSSARTYRRLGTTVAGAPAHCAQLHQRVRSHLRNLVQSVVSCCAHLKHGVHVVLPWVVGRCTTLSLLASRASLAHVSAQASTDGDVGHVEQSLEQRQIMMQSEYAVLMLSAAMSICRHRTESAARRV